MWIESILLRLSGPPSLLIPTQVSIYAANSVLATVFSRPLTLVPLDDPPSLASTVFNTSPWTESSSPLTLSPPLSVFNSVSLTDVDDTQATLAWVSLDTAPSVGVYAACDPTRDALQLLSSYNGGAQPYVQGVWDATLCLLVLTPVGSGGGAGVTLTQMAAAVRAVQYTNWNARDPTNR